MLVEGILAGAACLVHARLKLPSLPTSPTHAAPSWITRTATSPRPQAIAPAILSTLLVIMETERPHRF